MTIRSDKMGQSWLLPLDISELIPVDHICYLVVAIVNGMDVKLKANASNKYTLSKAEIEALREIIERGIAIDEEEDRLYGDMRGDELPPELNTHEKLRKKIRELKQAYGKRLKNAAKKIIEQHALGDESDKEKVKKKLDKAEEELNTAKHF